MFPILPVALLTFSLIYATFDSIHLGGGGGGAPGISRRRGFVRHTGGGGRSSGGPGSQRCRNRLAGLLGTLFRRVGVPVGDRLYTVGRMNIKAAVLHHCGHFNYPSN